MPAYAGLLEHGILQVFKQTHLRHPLPLGKRLVLMVTITHFGRLWRHESKQLTLITINVTHYVQRALHCSAAMPSVCRKRLKIQKPTTLKY
jgi:hypothetical protein